MAAQTSSDSSRDDELWELGRNAHRWVCSVKAIPALGGYAVRWEAEPLRFTVESLPPSRSSRSVDIECKARRRSCSRAHAVDTRGCFTVRDRVLGACLQQRVDRVYAA